MTFSKLQWRIFCVFAIADFCFGQYYDIQDICSKFDIGGPCDLLQPPRNGTSHNNTKAATGSPFCNFVCSQGDAEMFSFVCRCDNNVIPATTSTLVLTTITTPLITTTAISTTTPRPVTCFYTTRRPARRSGRTRRMYSGTPVIPECEYPGVIGLFWVNSKGLIAPACTASLLSEDVLLLNAGGNCLTIVKSKPVYVLSDSYQVSDLTKMITVIPSSVKKLDASGIMGGLYTVNISTKLKFNSDCVQPVCVPNINIPATDIDFNDCRLVGYGGFNNTLFLGTPQLNEIRVNVNPTSIRSTNLTVTRVGSLKPMSCMGDDAAPLICSHKTTNEWVTVGITVTPGFPCTTMTKPQVVTSLLKEATNQVYYKSIQNFKYADPNVFTAESDK